jgi:hypothetical protein
MTDEYDIPRLLEYKGPSLRQKKPMEGGVILLDYRNSDENERNVSTLLSSKSIPFHIERPEPGWKGRSIRMEVTVPRERSREAEAVLSAGARAGAIEVVEGFNDLLSRS